jgi:hypothetical protein
VFLWLITMYCSLVCVYQHSGKHSAWSYFLWNTRTPFKRLEHSVTTQKTIMWSFVKESADFLLNESESESESLLRPTVSRPVCPGTKHPPIEYFPIFILSSVYNPLLSIISIRLDWQKRYVSTGDFLPDHAKSLTWNPFQLKF